MTFKSIKLGLLTLVLTQWSVFAQAAINLELTQGVSSAMPIAVPAFAGENSLQAQQITPVIAADLKNSGMFRVVNTAEDNNSGADIAYWRKKGADNIVKGKVESTGSGYQVSFQLLDPVSQQIVLLDRQFNVQAKDLRRLAHHISDLVYEKLTGTRGVFATRIAYIMVKNKGTPHARFTLEVADADGHNPRALLSSSRPIMSPKWSPDGKQIAYVSFENKRSEIYIVNVSTGQRQLLSRHSGINNAPAWSPDGNRLAVVLSKSGSPNIYVLDVGSKSLRQITSDGSINTEPRWSPDGQSLIFTSDRGGAPQVYQVNLATQKVQRLTFDGSYNATPSFTPNGQEIVLMHRGASGFNIAIQNVKTGILKTLTYSGTDESPSVAPNGKMIIYATRLGGQGALSVVSSDGRVKMRLPAREGEVQEPAWSPFLG